MSRFLVILIGLAGLHTGVANAQDPHAHYEINGQTFGLFGYYVSRGSRPHFLAVFRPRGEQSRDPKQFDFEAACEVVLASLPEIDGIPKIEPTGGVIFFQVIQGGMNVSNYTEFDIDDTGCSKAEPASIYTPVPGFTPGISDR